MKRNPLSHTVRPFGANLLILSLLLALSACAAPAEVPESAPTLPAPTPSASAFPASPTVSATSVSSGAGPTWPEAALQVQAAFAQEFGLPVNEVTVASAEASRWENDCLGVPLPGEACGNGPLSGYRVTLRVKGEDYVYRVDETGRIIRPETPPSAPEESPLLVWTFEDPTGCTMALVGLSTVQFGPCSGVTLHRPLISAEKETLQAWVRRYAPFEVQTEAGFVQMVGQGTVQPSAEEALQVARWAQTLVKISGEQRP